MEQQRIFASRDRDATHDFLRSKEFRFDVARGETPRLDAHINGLYLPGMYIGFMQYGAAVTIQGTAARDDYWIHLPLRRSFEARVGTRSFTGSATQGVVLHPSRENLFHSEPDCARLSLSLTASAVRRHLTMLLGELPQTDTEFAPTIDVATGFGRSLQRLVCWAAADLERSDSALRDSSIRAQFEEFVIGGMLLTHSHTCSQRLRRDARSPAPRDVRRALDFIHASADTAVGLADIVMAAGVAGRTLYKHFEQTYGVSPVRYARLVRLDHSRQVLLNDRTANVTTVALACGFSHMGRFACEYRRRFGETPSQTLRRTRAAP